MYRDVFPNIDQKRKEISDFKEYATYLRNQNNDYQNYKL